jgi:hypothetical protein
MTWSTQHLMKRMKTMEDTMKRTMIASVCAVTLLLAAGSAARAETIALLSWGATNDGTATGEEAASEGDEGPTENRNPDKPSPKLLD